MVSTKRNVKYVRLQRIASFLMFLVDIYCCGKSSSSTDEISNPEGYYKVENNLDVPKKETGGITV